MIFFIKLSNSSQAKNNPILVILLDYVHLLQSKGKGLGLPPFLKPFLILILLFSNPYPFPHYLSSLITSTASMLTHRPPMPPSPLSILSSLIPTVFSILWLIFSRFSWAFIPFWGRCSLNM